jgi:hypothetical protein
MRMSRSRADAPRRSTRRVFAATGCALTLLCLAQAPGALGVTAVGGGGQAGQPGTGGDVLGASAMLEQCVAVGGQAERSATFSGEMTAIAGTARMTMRIDVQERTSGETAFHTITAPGLGVWRGSDAGVKIYKYVKQVTNLSSPALYRAVVRFHWLSAKGHIVKRGERLTSSCDQPAAAVVPTPTPTPTTPGAASTSGAATTSGSVSTPSSSLSTGG